ncbi:MAG: hypothetical protein AAGA92_06440 [Planctomycetota bacterium]
MRKAPTLSEMLKAALAVPIPFNMIIVCTMFLASGAAVVGVAMQVRKIATHRMDLDIKRRMVEEGMTAEEIERVLRASRESGGAEEL